MSLKLYLHPLASFCHKVLIALYENDIPFEPHIVDLGNAASAAAFKAIWPIGKFPVLRDEAKGRMIPESTIIIEYLDRHYPGEMRLVPDDAERAAEVRLRDRFFDLYVHMPMQTVVGDRLRPPGQKDPHGVAQARALLETACRMVDEEMGTRTWAMGETFTMADCAAAPALFYTDKVMPLGDTYRNAAAYLGRLMQRPSYARALKEAEPYFALFPKE
jgi:glutathione S-transferase